MTQGKEPVIVATSSGNGAPAESLLVPVPPVPTESIVDTNGCGDACVAGFFGGLIRGKPVADAVRDGIALSAEILKKRGCEFD